MKADRLILTALVVAGIAVVVVGQSLSIVKALASSEHLSVTKLGTSAEEPTTTKPLTLSLECDDKGTYIRGTFMILKGEYVVCNGHIVSFGDSFKRSGKSFTIGSVNVTSNGTVAMVEGQEADGIVWDGTAPTVLKPQDKGLGQAVKLSEKPDLSKIYKWESKWDLGNIVAEGIIVRDAKGKHGRTEQIICTQAGQKGRVPFIGGGNVGVILWPKDAMSMADIAAGRRKVRTEIWGFSTTKGPVTAVIDLPGSQDVHIEIDRHLGTTKYAGLIFTSSCILSIQKDHTLVADKEGIIAKDAEGRLWQSRKVKVGGKEVTGFFPLRTQAAKADVESLPASSESTRLTSLENAGPHSEGEPTGKLPIDLSKRYKWKSKWSLPFAGERFIVRDEKGGKAIRLVEQGKGSIPVIGKDLMIDLPGTKDVHVEIDPKVEKTTYAGLTFTAPCVIEILKDSTVVVQQAGIVAKDARWGNRWVSKSVMIDGTKTFAFFMDVLPPKAEKSTKPNAESLLPAFKEELKGSNPVRVRNPNDFAVSVGVRVGQKGRNFDVPANGANTVYVPNGDYDIYFVYFSKPDALFQGDSFTLKGNGVEIQIVKVVGGNYNIRRVK